MSGSVPVCETMHVFAFVMRQKKHFGRSKAARVGFSTVGDPKAVAKAAAKRPERATGGQTQQKLRASRVGVPEGWRSQMEWGSRRVGVQHFSRFFLPSNITLFVLSLGVFSWNFGGV